VPTTAAGEVRPKVFLICYSYPPVLGGSEVEAQRICAALIRRGYQVEVLTGSEHPMPQQKRWVDDCGIPVRILGIGWPGQWRQRMYAAQVGWILLTESRDYQMVYCLMQGLHLAVSLLVSRFLNKPLVMKVSGSDIIPRMRQSWLGRLELKWLQQWAKKVMILNDGMVEEAREAGFDTAQLLWMPNPVDVDEFCPLRDVPQRDLLRGEKGLRGPAAVYVGRLAPEKELLSLVGGFALALKKCPDAELVLVGDGPCYAELDALARQLGVRDRVHFPGRAPAEVVLQWLQACDVFALVSRIEGFSCSLSEAMSAGLPSVVSDISGNSQLIDPEVHGLRSELRNEASIADCLVRLFEDPALRARMGEAARLRIVDNYSLDQVADRYEQLIQEVI